MVSVKPSEVKSATFDKKLFSVLDRQSNTLTVSDNVRVLDGPLKVYQQFQLKTLVIFNWSLCSCNEQSFIDSKLAG